MGNVRPVVDAPSGEVRGADDGAPETEDHRPRRPDTLPFGIYDALTIPRRSLPPWAQEVEERCLSMLDVCDAPRSDKKPSVAVTPEADPVERARDLLEGALFLAQFRRSLRLFPSRIVDWWSGSSIEMAWRRIHQAEEALLRSTEDAEQFGRMLAIAETHLKALPEDDPVAMELSARMDERFGRATTPAGKVTGSATSAGPA